MHMALFMKMVLVGKGRVGGSQLARSAGEGTGVREGAGTTAGQGDLLDADT